MKRSDDRKNRTGMVFLLIFMFLAAGILTGGFFAYQSYEQNFRTEAERQLSAIAELKANQLVEYRKERMGDAHTFFKNPAFSNLVRQFFEKTSSGIARRQLQIWLANCQSQYAYNAIFLLDTRGIVRMSVPDAMGPIASSILQSATEVLRSGTVAFQDFYRNEVDHKVYLALLVPIIDDIDRDRRLGVLLLRIDPAVNLYPFIRTWPVPSRSSETLVVRREGDDVLFLNELRFRKNSALSLRFPLSNEKLPAAQAALGHTGVMEGVDYRGVLVIAAIRSVPDSPWFLVARTDQTEVYAPRQSRLWLMVILVGALISVSGAGVGLVWRHQRHRFYREQYKTSEALKESESRYRSLFENMLEGVALHEMVYDAAGIPVDYRLLDVNGAFEKFTGIPRDRARGALASQLYGAGSPPYLSEYSEVIRSGKALTFETHFPPMDKSFSISAISPKPGHFATIFLDISDRKRSDAELRRLFDTSERSRSSLLSILEDQKRVEEALRESQSLYYSFIEQLPNAVFRKDREGRYVLVNPEFCRLKDMKKEDFIGKTPMEVAASDTNAQGTEGPATKYAHVGEDVHEQILQSGKTFETEEEYLGTDGENLQMYVVRMPVFDSRQTIIGTQGIMFDVSERRRAEEKLRERGAELSARNEELERFNAAASGRELRMINLKQEINELCKKMDLPTRYRLDFLEADVSASVGRNIDVPSEK